MLDYYDRILSIYMPAAELYYRCTQPRITVVTTNSTFVAGYVRKPSPEDVAVIVPPQSTTGIPDR